MTYNIVCIPARYSAQRFPGKLLEKIGHKTVLRQTIENAVDARSVDRVVVLTSDQRIADEAAKYAEVVLSIRDVCCGSDRIGVWIKGCSGGGPDWVVMNLQADEPEIKPETIDDLFANFNTGNPEEILTAVYPIDDREPFRFQELCNLDRVKVIAGNKRRAIYFTRDPVNAAQFLHVGVYVAKGDLFMDSLWRGPSPLELAERLEQLRWIERHDVVRFIELDYKPRSVNRSHDLEMLNDKV